VGRRGADGEFELAVGDGQLLRRTSPLLRRAGAGYAITLPVFFVSGLPGGPVQPVVGVLFTAAAVVIVRHLRQGSGSRVDDSTARATVTRAR
jgi:hypothetical protein